MSTFVIDRSALLAAARGALCTLLGDGESESESDDDAKP